MLIEYDNDVLNDDDDDHDVSIGIIIIVMSLCCVCVDDIAQLIICGQAKSHCVRYTTVDILKHWHVKPHSAIYFLSDGE